MHVLWHLAVMLGGSFHYLALWRFVSFRIAAAAKDTAAAAIART
jgi:hypothetical protein